MNQEQKLERFAEREIRKNIDNIIIANDDGDLIAFGRYHIQSTKTEHAVSTWDREIHRFSSKRTALAWCSADKCQQYNLANTILILDRKKQALATDIYTRKSMGELGKHEGFYEIVNTKIQPKIDQYTSVSAELEKCVNQAKYIQIRGFNNETARTIGPNAK
jgi:hypothetical protein